MKKVLLSVLTAIGLVLPMGILGQTTIIGAGSATGTSSNIGPIYRSSAASSFDFSQQYYLYTQAELSAAGINPGDFINSVAFFKDNGFGTVAANNVSIWRIYMKNSAATPSTTWSSGSFTTQSSGATLVYDNPAQVIPTATGFITLTFSAPFLYTGGSLEIGSYWDCSLYVGNPTDGAFSWKRDPLTNQVFGSSNSTATMTMTLQSGRPQIQIGYTPGSPCVAPPTAGTASSVSSICPATNFSVSLTGNSYGAGQTYQWQKSTTGTVGSFANIAGATNTTATVNQSVPTYYRCVATCSGMSDTTAAILVNVNDFTTCYCNSIPSSAIDEEIYNVTINGGSTDPLYANTNGCTAVAPGPGSVLQRYSNFKTLAPITTVTPGQVVNFSIVQDECNGPTYFANGIAMWIDYNHNGSFSDAGEQVYVENTTTTGPRTINNTFTVPVTALTGNTAVRIICAEGFSGASLQPCMTYTYGETEDHLINIQCPTLTGPTALDAGVCSGNTVTLNATPSFPTATISWWDAAVGGTQVGTGTSFTSPVLVANTAYYPQEDFPSCPSGPRDTVTVTVSAVDVVLSPIHVTCNGFNNGSFTQSDTLCGTAPFEFSVDGGAFGPIPTDLLAGSHNIIVRDANMDSSVVYVLTINEPGAPTALNATNVTYFNATLGWTQAGDETSWVVEYGPTGFTPGTGTIINPATNPQPVSGLTENTTYDFYVAAGCAAGSDFAGPFTFSTDPGFLAWDSQCGPGFIDISTTGTQIAGMTDDSESGLTLPWPWNVNGTIVNTITIGNNGGVLFNTTTGNIGYTATGNGMFPYVQDLNTVLAGGGIYYESIGTAPNRQFIIQWNNIPHWSTGTDGASFEILVDEATSEVYYLYNDVMMSNAAWDNGADAEIKLITANGTATVSMNSATYLSNNSCAHFYNALCPNVQNFSSLVFADDAIFDWDAGLYGETEWTMVYGLAGFDPNTPGQELGTQTLSSSDASFGGTLTQLTCYDVYIYSECAADNLTSDGFFFNFCTLPYCSNPSALAGSTDVDSLELTWSWTESSATYPVTSFNIQYGMNGMTATEVIANGTDLSDTIMDASLLAGGVYEVYIQAACAGTNDTSGWVGPITLVMPLSNDTVCGAEMLALDNAYTFNNTGATVSVDETNIAPPATGAQMTDGWANSTLNGTTWFKFTAPASGSVRINNTAINYNGQTAVYDAADCGDFNSNFIMLAANDNEIGGTSLASNFTVCGLTPNSVYYIMHDGSGTSGIYSISISEIVLEAGLAQPLTQICTGDVIDLFTTINGNDTGGEWSAPVAAADASISGSTFNSNGLGYQVFDFQYRMTDGCAYDSIISQVQIFGLSSAGVDGVLTVCKNEPVDLLSGLGGNADLGGTWYDPTNNAIPSSSITASAFPGSFNYDYITGNGVCPDDTSNVVLTVLPSCDYLSIQEEVFAGVEVYPNPTTGILNIDADQAFAVKVTDANGRVIRESAQLAAGTSTIDLAKVQIGVYFVELSNEKATKVFRIVVQ